MSERPPRRASAQVLRDSAGDVVCSCGCGRKPQPPRQTWFSADCVHQWRIRNDPGYARAQVLERDGGRCAECGFEAEELRLLCLRIVKHTYRSISWMDWDTREMRAWEWSIEMGIDDPHPGPSWMRNWLPEVTGALEQAAWQAEQIAADACTEAGMLADWLMSEKGLPSPEVTWWQADHIHEVVRGGGQCGLENLQTLCLECHKRKTARLARERADERRARLRCEKLSHEPELALAGSIQGRGQDNAKHED